MLSTFEEVAGALQSQKRDLVAEYLPDTAIRKRVVDAFQQLAPKPGSGWILDLSRIARAVRKMYTQLKPSRIARLSTAS